MSESDDTDFLLLIPPDFFIVNPDQDDFIHTIDSRNVEREVVNDLITQVNDLESRICAIENSDGSRSRSLTENTFHSLNSEFGNLFCGTSSQISDFEDHTSKLDSNLLQNTSRSPSKELNFSLNMDSKLKEPSSPEKGGSLWSPSKRLDLPEVDRLLKEMEMTQAEIENKLRERETDFGLNTTKLNQPEIQRKINQYGDNIGSIPDLGFGIRSAFAKSPSTSPQKNLSDNSQNRTPAIEEPPCIKQTAIPWGDSRNDNEGSPRWKTYLSHDYPSSSRNDGKIMSSSFSPERIKHKPPRRRLNLSSDSPFLDKSLKSTIEHDLQFGNEKKTPLVTLTQNENDIKRDTKMMDPAKTEQINSFVNQIEAMSLKNEKDRKPYQSGGCGDKLLSLVDLWNPEEGNIGNNPLKLRQKLEEERYRRLHLEQTIQSLQKKVLEEQERVAVAMKVDEAKDKAIGHITKAWRQMVDHWKKLEEQRHQMAQTLLTERAAFKKGQEETFKKVERWEKEVSQALDLAATFKKKSERLEEELRALKEVMDRKSEEVERKLRMTEEKLGQLEEERTVLVKKLQISEEEHDQERQLVFDARNDLAKAEDELSKALAELAVVKEQRDLLSTRLKEERGRISTLELQKNSLQEALTDAKNAEAKAEEEAKAALSGLDRAKADLRNMYQAQLEAVVREKLEEFQGQLDRAQSAMQAQLQEGQRIAEEKSLQQQQTLVNSHVIEMRRLESMHKEEIRSLENKLIETQRRCSRLESGKKDIAQKLHSVMESQWQQALSIITSELSIRQAEPEQNKKEVINNFEKDKRFDLNLHGVGSCSGSVSSIGRSEEIPFNKDGQVTYRVSNPAQPLSTIPPGKQDQLMKYIQMLLEKQPGHPIDSLTSSGVLQDITVSDVVLDETNEGSKWNDIMTKKDQREVGFNEQKPGVNGRMKPPWK